MKWQMKSAGPAFCPKSPVGGYLRRWGAGCGPAGEEVPGKVVRRRSGEARSPHRVEKEGAWRTRAQHMGRWAIRTTMAE
eukprot:2592487-Pyramimonas_sp.AAC.1